MSSANLFIAKYDKIEIMEILMNSKANAKIWMRKFQVKWTWHVRYLKLVIVDIQWNQMRIQIVWRQTTSFWTDWNLTTEKTFINFDYADTEARRLIAAACDRGCLLERALFQAFHPARDFILFVNFQECKFCSCHLYPFSIHMSNSGLRLYESACNPLQWGSYGPSNLRIVCSG